MNETKAIAKIKSPQIISVSAGKGGVGKTLISVNLARTLSWSGKRVLLVDMDLYNRGSTTLVAEPPITGKITVAGLMEMAHDTRITRLRKTIAETELAEAKDDEGNPIPLYLIPSTITNSIVDWAHHTYAIEQLRDFMGKVVREVATKYDIECVVFDCRPGPEPLFLAAAGISTEIILVTEADIVTLNGNINLYSYLSNVYKENSEVLRNVRFVINRIPKGQDIDHIEQRYMKRLYDLFKTRPVLASIPFETRYFSHSASIGSLSTRCRMPCFPDTWPVSPPRSSRAPTKNCSAIGSGRWHPRWMSHGSYRGKRRSSTHLGP